MRSLVSRLSIYLVATGLAGLVVAQASAAPGDDAKVKKELMAQFDKAVAQFKAKDLKGFMSMYTDDYKGKGMDGKPQDKKGAEAEMKAAMDNTKSVKSARYTIDKLTVKGNTATIEGSMVMDMDVVDPDGQMGPKGATHRMHMVMKTRDVDVKAGSTWKTKSSEPLPGSMTMVDGKPFPPPHPPAMHGPPGKKK